MKSSYCGNSYACVEVIKYQPSELQSVREQYPQGAIIVRRSQHSQSLIFTPEEWGIFIQSVKDGQFDYGMLSSL